MRSALFLILALCCSFARADLSAIQSLNEIRTSSNLFTASIMVYFNPKDRMPDERSLQAANAALNSLSTQVVMVSSPPAMNEPLQEMDSLFKELDGIKRSQSAVYPEKILQVLQSNKAMQAAVDQAYQAEMLATPSALALLNEQGQVLSILLRDYQLRRYPLNEQQKAAFALDPAQLPVLDQQVDNNFIGLINKYPANADYLEPAYKSYRFVRGQLLQSKGRPNGGAEFYMSRNVVDLNDLGRMLAEEGEDGEAGNLQDI